MTRKVRRSEPGTLQPELRSPVMVIDLTLQMRMMGLPVKAEMIMREMRFSMKILENGTTARICKTS